MTLLLLLWKTEAQSAKIRGRESLDPPMKGKADGSMTNMPLLYMVNVTAKYMARLPNRKKVFTAVQ